MSLRGLGVLVVDVSGNTGFFHKTNPVYATGTEFPERCKQGPSFLREQENI